MPVDYFNTYDEERGCSWMLTISGRRFFPGNPRMEDVDIGDIAHALGHECRYGGHVKKFYSVAEHCVLLHDYAWKKGWSSDRLMALLLHDASEAYIRDIPSPAKPDLGSRYGDMEYRLMRTILKRYNVLVAYEEMKNSIKVLDRRICVNEMAVLMHHPDEEWYCGDVAALQDVRIANWSHAEATTEFLRRFAALSHQLRGNRTHR